MEESKLMAGVRAMVEEISPENTEDFAEQEDWTREDEDTFNGEEAGVTFAQRHVLEKITLFVKVYREKGYSEAFIEGFLSGINGALGSGITLETSEGDQVDSGQ